MPRQSALTTLERVDRSGERARETLAEVARLSELASRDRDLANELVQGVLRHRSALGAVLAHHASGPWEKTHATLRRVLELGAYQVLHLDRVPRRAAVHTSVELAKAANKARASGFVNAVLRGLCGSAGTATPGEGDDPRRCYVRGDGTHVTLEHDVFPDPAVDADAHLAARWSMPVWIVERLRTQRGDDALMQVLRAGLARPPVALRPTAAHAEELRAALVERGLHPDPEGPCLLLATGGKVASLPGFAEGWFNVQDPTAAEAALALDVRPGEAVLDLCAAPGGKTLVLAEAVGPEGIVLAVDRTGSRLDLLRKSLAKRNLAHVAVLEADARAAETLPRGVRDRPQPGFDAVLLDVPCSNTGVLGRRVEVRWRMTPARVKKLASQATKMLDVAASRVAVGGRLLYSTCSLDREENEDIVAAFVAGAPAFELASETLTLPVAGRRDGGYRALLRRTRAD